MLVITNSINYSQDMIAEVQNTFHKTEIKKSTPLSFEEKTQNNNTPNHIKYFEDLASKWGKKQVYQFGKSKEHFNATFKSNKGQIIATYDENGSLIAAEEHFNNLALPKHLIFSIYEKYKGWKVIGNTYSTSYKKRKYLNTVYEVQLQKGSKVKNIKIDTNTIH